MSYSVSGTMITLTRGDTFSALITITDLNDNQYIPMNGDRIRFAMKNDYNDETPLLIKEIPIDTMILTLNPEDTKHLPFGKYVYDIELTKATGEVDTFITNKLSAVIDFNAYSGEYEVVPNAFNTQVLPTANKVLKKDIVVQKVPYFETSNNYDGVTVYIAEEVNQNA